MTQSNLEIYFNWSCNQLAGESVATDLYLRQNLDVIRKVAIELLYKTGNTVLKPLYRGVIMKYPDMERLQPSTNFTSLSFSEDKKIAEQFADPEHYMAEKLVERGDKYGYIIEYKPLLISEVLFHHDFLKLFPYVDCILLGLNVDASKIHLQKEVTILQPIFPFNLKKYDKNNPAII